MVTLERASDPTTTTAGELREIESSAPSTPRAASSKLVIASYNIRYAVGSLLISGSIGRRIGIARPGRRPRLVEHNLELAAKALSSDRIIPPVDILALQEADKLTTRAGGHHVARELAETMRMNFAYASAERPEGEQPKSRQWYLDFEEHIPANDIGQTGVAILSRFPFLQVNRIDLPWHACPWRPRLALAARIESGHGIINLFNAHIDPHAEISEQLEQHETILASAADTAGPTILAGDFNTLSKRSRIRMRSFLESRGFVTPFSTGTATWRAGLVRLHTDWIFVRDAKVIRYGVARPLGVSDHWPVWVEVDLNHDAGKSL